MYFILIILPTNPTQRSAKDCAFWVNFNSGEFGLQACWDTDASWLVCCIFHALWAASSSEQPTRTDTGQPSRPAADNWVLLVESMTSTPAYAQHPLCHRFKPSGSHFQSSQVLRSQITPASSWWPQLCWPQPKWKHSDRKGSWPAHSTLSSRIGPEP